MVGNRVLKRVLPLISHQVNGQISTDQWRPPLLQSEYKPFDLTCTYPKSYKLLEGVLLSLGWFRAKLGETAV